MAFAMPTVIPKTRTTTLGGERLTSERLVVEMNTQSLADVRSMIRGITREVARQQIALGNPPQIAVVDGRTNKPVDDALRNTVVLYGVALAATAMREVESELAAAIARATTPHSGRLANIASSWQWLFIPKGGAPHPISAGSPPKAFGAGDQLVLVPRDVPYATLVNRSVAIGGKLNATGKKGRRAAKAKQNQGFFATATAAVRAKPIFRQFSVSTQFSTRHMVPGELMTRTSGTGMIVIRPRIRRLRV